MCVLKSDFVLVPCLRKNAVKRDFVARELCEFARQRVQEADVMYKHACAVASNATTGSSQL